MITISLFLLLGLHEVDWCMLCWRQCSVYRRLIVKNLCVKVLLVYTLPNKEFSTRINCSSFLIQYNGTPKRPRLSVFCSDKQLYAMLVDDQNKKCLFYGSTLQKSIRQNPPCSTIVSIPSLGYYSFVGNKQNQESNVTFQRRDLSPVRKSHLLLVICPPTIITILWLLSFVT